MATDKTYKDGGSGKGQALRQGLNLVKYGENLDKTRGTRFITCLDCTFFKGINSVDMVNCIKGISKSGLQSPCNSFLTQKNIT